MNANYKIYLQINTVQVRYINLLPTSSSAWTAVANAQSREPSTAGHSQADLPGTNPHPPPPELDLHRLHTAFTLAESTVSASRSTKILSLFRFKRAGHTSPSRSGRGSDERERDQTGFSVRSGPTPSIRVPPTRAPTAATTATEKGGKSKGSKFSRRSFGFIPSFIGNLGCHGLMIR